MTPEQEIQRIETDYKGHWQRLEKHPDIIAALNDNDPIKLGEVAALLVYGECDRSNGLKYQNYRHEVMIDINNESLWFVTLEAAKLFVTNKRLSDKSANIGGAIKKAANGLWEDVTI